MKSSDRVGGEVHSVRYAFPEWRESLRRRTGTAYALAVLAPIPLVYIYYALAWSAEHRLQADFTGYYTAATIVARGMGARLYDLDLQRLVQREIIYPYHFEVGGVLPFQYPPFAVLPVLPLASWPIHPAYYIWGVANLAMFVAALLALSASTPHLGRCPRLRTLLWVASFAFLPTWSAFVLGQLSFLVLLAYAVGFQRLRRGADLSAGVFLSGVAVKPHLLLAAPLMLAARRRWGPLAGLCAGCAGLSGLALLLVGPFDAAQFLETSRETSGWISLSFNLTWMGFLAGLLAPWPEAVLPATVALDGLSLYLLWLAWRGQWRPDAPVFSLRLSLLLLVSIAVAPHLYPHDLVLLIPVAFYTADYLVGARASGRQLAWAKLLAALVFATALVDSYPMLALPARPMFVAMVAAGWATFAAIRGSREEERRGAG